MAIAGERADIVIRADGNADIGAGHLMRCLTIADAVREKKRVVFWCADEDAAAMVRERGYAALSLGSDYRDMMSEMSRLRRLYGGLGRTVGMGRNAVKIQKTILVDSYFVSEEYLQALRAYGKVYLLEDMPGHVWPVDGIINYNAFAGEEEYRAIYGKRGQEAQPQLYIGASYVPLRPPFAGREYQVGGQVKEVLVTAGGGDRENIAGRILEIIGDMGCRAHVVSGPCNPHGEWLDTYAAAHPWVCVHRQVEDMAGLMLQCDLAVTAGGTTVYELCALGIPFVCFSCAENQEELAAYAGSQGIGLDAGKFHHDPAGTLQRIGDLARQAAADLGQRQQMSQRARMLVDGQGAGRLAAALKASSGDGK